MGEPAEAAGRRTGVRSLVPIGLGLLLLGAGLFEARRIQASSAAMDFYAAWAISQALGRDGEIDPYASASLERITAEMVERAQIAGQPPRLSAAIAANRPLRSTGTPTFLAVFRPASQGTYKRDLRRFQTASLVLFLFGLAVFGRLAGADWGNLVLWGAVALLVFEPLDSDLRVGNVNQMLLGCLAAVLLLADLARSGWARVGITARHGSALTVTAGAILGAVVSFKPLMALVPTALVLRWWCVGARRRAVQLAAGCVLGLLLGVGLSALAFRSLDPWIAWTTSLRSVPTEATQLEMGNVSLSRWLAEALNLPTALVAALLLSVLGAISAWALSQGRVGMASSHRSRDDVRVASLALVVLFLASPLVWLHYLVLLLPALVVLVEERNGWFPYTALICVCFAGIALAPLWWLGIPTPSPVSQLAMCLLFALLVVDVARIRRAV